MLLYFSYALFVFVLQVETEKFLFVNSMIIWYYFRLRTANGEGFQLLTLLLSDNLSYFRKMSNDDTTIRLSPSTPKQQFPSLLKGSCLINIEFACIFCGLLLFYLCFTLLKDFSEGEKTTSIKSYINIYIYAVFAKFSTTNSSHKIYYLSCKYFLISSII